MTDTNPAKFKKLVTLLKELFQLDQPDLDFGIYRIMHARAGEVTQFLERDLLPQVKDAFTQYQSADGAELKKKLEQMIAQLTEAGVDPEQAPKVCEMREQLKGAIDLGAVENAVYDHLYSFFRRYYSEGDYLAKRVYKPGVYAIPYEGEEVVLHWANKDQYYIKTSEYLRDYAFRLKPEAGEGEVPMRVHFKLSDAAEGEHGNVKAAEGRDRVFVLAAEEFIALKDGELELRFEYRPSSLEDWPTDQRDGKKKPPVQKDLTALAVERVLAAGPVFADWLAELQKAHIKADGGQADYSRIEAHLRRYTARNTFDYFIHKDLDGFLRRELDFYIKNEVMHLDDVESETAPKVEQYISKIKVIRRIAGKIIDFLAQLENFQKKLWLKKKFVVSSTYCVTLDRVPTELYAEIAGHHAQWEKWRSIGSWTGIDGTEDDLRNSPHLMVDTALFAPQFQARLLQAFVSIDEDLDGVVVHGDNFQGLRLAEARFKSAVTDIYIDPPYNTDAAPIIYKNGFKDSSWLSLVANRVAASLPLQRGSTITCVTIDDVEMHRLQLMLEQQLGQEALGVVAIKNNPAGRTATVGFSTCHEYALFFGDPSESRVGRLVHSDAQKARYKEQDDRGAFEWTNFRKHGGANTFRTERPKQFYPIYIHGQEIRIPDMRWDEARRQWEVLDEATEGEITLFPIDEKERERIWDFGANTAREGLKDLSVRLDSKGNPAVYRKWRINSEGLLPQTIWDSSRMSAAAYGTNLLSDMFGETHLFSFPKSLHAVIDCLRVTGAGASQRVVLDYYAGSGTTGHAVIEMNRIDGCRRKYLLMEQGDYLEAVIKSRIQKAVFARDWKGGRPVGDRAGISHAFKVVKIESYEDALGNLDLHRTQTQGDLLESNDARKAGALREQYLLRYQLDVESRGSASLLNIQSFSDPSAYKLKIKTPGSDESRDVNVDLLETFNWLLGLTVQHIAAPRSFTAEFERDDQRRLQFKGRLKQDVAGPWWFRTVIGTTQEGRKTLVIWRKLTGDAEQDNLVLETWFRDKQAFSVRDTEFELIYVNGDNTLENLRLPDESWKVRLTEEDFQRLMFEGAEA